MSLGELQRTWNALAGKDAMWAVLTGPVGGSRRWDPEAFFRTGADEIRFILDRVAAAGLTPRRGRALDFGLQGWPADAGAGRGSSSTPMAWTSPRRWSSRHAPSTGRRPLRLSRQRRRRPVAAGRRARSISSTRASRCSTSPPRIQPALHRRVFRGRAGRRRRVFQLPSAPIDHTATHPLTALVLPPDACRAASRRRRG